MSNCDRRIEEIKEREVGITGKTVLLVEGINDVTAFSIFLDKKFPGWEANWVLTHAGGIGIVKGILEKEPNWIGVVDRDEWTEEQIATLTSNHWVLPRFCLESYMINPSEIWNALPPTQQSKIVDGENRLRSEIMTDIDKWLRHGAVWSIVNPMWSGLRSLGFKEYLLKVENTQNDEVIISKLNEWHDFLEPDDFMARFSQKLIYISQLLESERLYRWIHGKQFFKQHVVAKLNTLLEPKSSDDWRNEILRTLPIPSDFDPLWQKMGLN